MEPTTTELTREDRIREYMREHVAHESWEADLCDDVPGDHRRWLLVEQNAGGQQPPVWLSTHDSPEDAANYWTTQEYRDDWNPLFIADLDTGERRSAHVDVSFEEN